MRKAGKITQATVTDGQVKTKYRVKDGRGFYVPEDEMTALLVYINQLEAQAGCQ